MSRLNVYFITQAEDLEEAGANVESWLEDYLGREFYTGFDVVKEDIKRVYELDSGFFGSLKHKAQNEVAVYKKRMEEWETEGNTYMVGYCHVCIGHILMESFCHDMPFYNLETTDWTEPDKNDWAVKVSLHY